MNGRLIVVGIVVILVAVVGFLLLGGSDDEVFDEPNIIEVEEIENVLEDVGESVEIFVDIVDFAFSSEVLNINVGDTVTWTNGDSAKHTVTSDSGGELDSVLLAKGESYSHTFNEVGTFNYHCTPHPYMTGVIVVS